MAAVELQISYPHEAQRQVLSEARRFNVLACGRRWGKTRFCTDQIIIPTALEGGQPTAWFAPTYKLLDEAWDAFVGILRPIHKHCRISKGECQIRLPTGGLIDFWSTEPRHAGDSESEVGRGRKYAAIVYDEAARARRLEADWTRAIRPTLADLRGSAWFPSTPKGHSYFHQLYVKGQEGEGDWASWQMPTSRNRYIHPDEIEAARQELPADAFSQEFLAEFLADAANPFGISAIRACVDDVPRGTPVVWGVDLAKSHDWTVATGLDGEGNVVAWQRWQGPWRNTMARLKAMIGTSPALVAATGVGDPIVAGLQAVCPHVEGYKFSRTSKQMLMEGLAVAIQSGSVTYPAGMIVMELEQFQYEYTPTGVRYTAPEGCHDDCVDSLAFPIGTWSDR